MPKTVNGIITNIQRFSVHDGPGIRTLVFMKGCFLSCRWCDNPETVNYWPELGFVKANCTLCGKCPSACPEQAITLDSSGLPVIDSQRCTDCGDCVAVCLPEALILYGKEMSVEEVLHVVRQDAVFYGDSGGVTVSGGEPLWQASFVKALFERCREEGTHTALETCGFSPRQTMLQVLPAADYVLFDLKLMDSQLHQTFTGKPNDNIHENAKTVVTSGVDVLFRSPLIPGVNDSPQNIHEMAHFLTALQGSEASLELMPYHQMGKAKYEALRRPYPMDEVQPPEAGYAESICQAYRDLGVRCTISI